MLILQGAKLAWSIYFFCSIALADKICQEKRVLCGFSWFSNYFWGIFLFSSISSDNSRILMWKLICRFSDSETLTSSFYQISSNLNICDIKEAFIWRLESFLVKLQTYLANICSCSIIELLHKVCNMFQASNKDTRTTPGLQPYPFHEKRLKSSGNFMFLHIYFAIFYFQSHWETFCKTVIINRKIHIPHRYKLNHIVAFICHLKFGFPFRTVGVKMGDVETPRTSWTSKINHFAILVNDFLLLTTDTKLSILADAGTFDALKW